MPVVPALILYWPSLTNAFEFDDISVWQIVNRYSYPWQLLGHTYGPTPGSLNPSSQGSPVWRPIFDVAWWFEVRLFGTNGTLFHATSVTMHGLTAGLLGLVAHELSGKRLAAALFASGLLLVQPFPQGVAWTSGALSSVMCTGFYLVTIYAVIRGERETRARRGWLVVGLVALALALGTYELALPAASVIATFTFLSSRGPLASRVRRTLLAVAPYAFLTAIYLVIRRQMLGDWVGVYGSATILHIDSLTVEHLKGVAEAFVKPVHLTTAERFAEQPLLATYWLGFIGVGLACLIARPDRRATFFGAVFMVVAFLPFAGFISVTDVLDSTRYLYAAEAGVALTFGLVLATTSVRRSRSLAFLPFLLLGIGSGGLLLRNEAPWREAGNMVSATIESARSGPIQVFGVPLYSFEGGFTFGPDVDYLARYPSGAVNVQLGNPVLRDRQLLYWNGNELRPVTAPTESWTGSETMETWSWADAVDASAADRDGVEIRSRTEDPFAISPVLNLDGSSAQVLSLSLDLRSPCQQGQVIWHTTSGVDYLTYFDLRMGLNTYVILAPSQLRTETVDKVRLDPLLCLATAVVYRVSIGGVLR